MDVVKGRAEAGGRYRARGWHPMPFCVKIATDKSVSFSFFSLNSSVVWRGIVVTLMYPGIAPTALQHSRLGSLSPSPCSNQGADLAVLPS